jgi:hypothetical protein
MEETFETRDRKRPLDVYVTPTERQAIERQASVHRGWQPVDASATLKGKCPCGLHFASLSRVFRVPLPVIRSLSAWGLVVIMSASAPLAVLSAGSQTEDGEPPALHSTIPQTEDGEPPVLHSTITSTEDGEPPVLHSTITPTEDGEPPVLHSTVSQNEYNHPQSPTVNMEDVRVVPPGTALDLVLLTEIEAGENVEGDGFFSKISKDVLVDGRVVIPTGTQVHGVLSTLEEPKRAGRNGYINARFDYLITPDGRTVLIEGNSTTRDSKGKAAAKVVGRAAGYTAIGGVVGTVIALQFGGLAAAVASHGTALAGGAAIGGAAGLTIAMLMKGKSVMLQPGAEMVVKLSEPLKLPTMTMPDRTAEDYSAPGLRVKVVGMRIGRGEITLTLDVLNNTENTFSNFDICLQDELLGNLYFPSPLTDGDRFSDIKPSSHVKSDLTFTVDSVKSRHKLVFFRPYSREPLAKFALTDAMSASGKASPKGKRVAIDARQPD